MVHAPGGIILRDVEVPRVVGAWHFPRQAGGAEPPSLLCVGHGRLLLPATTQRLRESGNGRELGDPRTLGPVDEGPVPRRQQGEKYRQRGREGGRGRREQRSTEVSPFGRGLIADGVAMSWLDRGAGDRWAAEPL